MLNEPEEKVLCEEKRTFAAVKTILSHKWTIIINVTLIKGLRFARLRVS